MNIITLLEMMAEAHPQRTAVTGDGESLDYGGLLAAARGLASELVGGGAAYCGHLAMSSLTTPVALFAAALAGVPYTPLNYRLTAAELSALVARIDPALLIVDPEYAARINVPPGVALVDRREALARALDQGEAAEISPSDPSVAVQLFTSGTTGAPKAAILRHENLFSYIIGSVEFASASEAEATLVAVPPYHIAAVSAILSSIYSGRRIVQLPSFDATEWLRLCREERVTNAFLVPTMLSRIVEHLDRGGERPDLPHLRAVAYGGGRMPGAIIARAMDLFAQVDFTNAYGLTETSSTICLLGPDDHRAAARSADPRVRRRLFSVGRSLPMVEIEVRDEIGQPLGSDLVGRVHVRGPQVSGEYGGLGSMVDAEGWFDTRDRGFLDTEGYLFLDGRADDVIVRGGENISPGEVEDALMGHAAVRDAAVVGIPDDNWGEAVAAAVVLTHSGISEAELQAWVRGRLRSSRVPQVIRFVEVLPYNELGKLLRRVVRDDFAAGDS